MSGSVAHSEDAVCDVCGQFGAYQFLDRQLCGDCYAVAGTCGAGGGPDQKKEDSRVDRENEG